MNIPGIYYPFLRGRSGEIKSLRDLSGSARAVVRPVLDLPSADTLAARELEIHVTTFVSEVAATWGTVDPLYFDLSRFGPSRLNTRNRHIVEHLFTAAKQARLRAIPVTGPLSDRGPELHYVEAVASIAGSDGRGAALRISYEDYSHPSTLAQEINAALQALRIAPSNVDLFLDAASIPHLQARIAKEADIHALVATAIEALRVAEKWSFRSVVLAGTSVPENLSAPKEGGPLIFERTEWKVWKELVGRVERVLIRFGDYAIWNSRFPDEGPTGRPPARVRFPMEDHQVYFHGRPGSYRGVCRDALKHPGVCDLPKSVGLAEIADASRGRSAGSPTDWVRRDTGIHVETAVRQIAD